MSSIILSVVLLYVRARLLTSNDQTFQVADLLSTQSTSGEIFEPLKKDREPIFKNSDRRKLPICTLGLAWTSQYNYRTFYYKKCSGIYTIPFSTFTYNTACQTPDPDPDLYTNHYTLTAVDTCTTSGDPTTCSYEINTTSKQLMFTTDGYSITFDTCDKQVTTNYQYQVDSKYIGFDGSVIHDGLYIVLQTCDICTWTSITTTSASLNHIYFPNNSGSTNYLYETILAQTPDCGYIESDYDYYGQMTDLSSLTTYKFQFTQSKFTSDANIALSLLPITLDLQWWVKPHNFCSTTALAPDWVPQLNDFQVTIYCRVSTLSTSPSPPFRSSYSAQVGTNLNIAYPVFTQNPLCGYTVTITAFTINNQASPSTSWFLVDDINKKLIIAAQSGYDAGSYSVTVTWSTTDTASTLKSIVSNTFTIVIQCLLTQITPSFAMATSYTVGALNTVETITFPTFTQTANCIYEPVFTYTLNGVTSGTAAWLTSISKTQLLIMPTNGSQDGTYIFTATWTYTDQLGSIVQNTQSFNIVIDVCSAATYSVPTMADLTLFYQGSAVSYSWANFVDSISTQSGIANACGVWSYTWVSTGNLSTDITSTAVNGNSLQFQWTSGLLSDFTQATPYLSTINGFQQGILKTSASFNTYFYCKLTSFTVSQQATAYAASIGQTTIIPFPAFTQTPSCGYSVSMQSYTVNSVANASYSWFTVQASQFSVAPTVATDIGVFVFVITWKITDTQGTVTTQTSTFTVTTSCVLTSISPSTTLASSYSPNTVLSPYTIAFPTFTQTPACGYLPLFDYTLNGVTSGTATWLTSISTNQMLITPQGGSDDDSYQFTVQWTFVDTLGASTMFADSFTVVIDVCSAATYSVPVLPDLTLYFQGPAVTYTWSSYIDSVSAATGTANSCGIWSYSWQPTSNLAYSVTKSAISANSFSLQWTSDVLSDYQIATPYTSSLIGYQNGILKTSANFFVYFACKLTSITKISESPQLISYTIGGNPITIPLSQYVQAPQCGISLTHTLTVNFKSTIPSWLSVSDSQLVVSSHSSKDQGLQYITIVNSYNDNDRFLYYDTDTIVVQFVQVNTAPYFETEPTSLFNIFNGQSWSYELPQAVDDEGDAITVSSVIPPALYFKQNTLSITSALSNTTNGTLLVSFTLSDTNGASNNYQIKLQFFNESAMNTTVNNSLVVNTSQSTYKTYVFKPLPIGIKIPSAKIASIKQTGLVTISFDQDLVPMSVDLLNEAVCVSDLKVVPVLQLIVRPGYYTDAQQLKFNHTITGFSARKLTLQMSFEHPSSVSEELQDPDILEIRFNDVAYFFTEFGTTIQNGTKLTDKLPQIYQGQVPESFVVVMTSLSQSSSYLIGGNIALNVLLSASLNQLWSMINTQQIIVLLPLFAINMPQNVALTFGFIMQIASFDILPTDSFYDKYFDMNQTEAVSQSFDNLGFNSMFFLYNMGSLSIAWFSIPVLIVFGVLLKCCRPITIKSSKLYRFSIWIDNYVFWSYPITTFNEASSIIYMTTLINLLQIDFSTTGNLVTTVLAIVSLAVALILPPLFAIVMLKNSKRLEEKAFKTKLGAIYEGLNTKNKKSAIQPLFFFARRLIMALLVCFNDHIVWQFMGMHLMFITSITIIGFTKPFKSRTQTITEYMNEIFIIILTYCMILFTDYINDFEISIKIGYLCCALVAMHLIANLAIMLLGQCKTVKMNWVRFKNRKNVKKVGLKTKQRVSRRRPAPKSKPVIELEQTVPQPHVTFAQQIIEVPAEGFTLGDRGKKPTSYQVCGSIKSSLQLPSIKESDENKECSHSNGSLSASSVSDLEKELDQIQVKHQDKVVPELRLANPGSVTSLLDRVLVSRGPSMMSIVTPQNKKERPEDTEFHKWAKQHEMPKIGMLEKQIQANNQNIADRNTATNQRQFSFSKIREARIEFTQKELKMFHSKQ